MPPVCEYTGNNALPACLPPCVVTPGLEARCQLQGSHQVCPHQTIRRSVQSSRSPSKAKHCHRQHTQTRRANTPPGSAYDSRSCCTHPPCVAAPLRADASSEMPLHVCKQNDTSLLQSVMSLTGDSEGCHRYQRADATHSASERTCPVRVFVRHSI